jgi:translation elongation factor EF-Tu-like GTPase
MIPISCKLASGDHKEIMNRKPDFIAMLKYYTIEQDGRAMPARSGYRPQLKFGFEEMQTSGQQVFLDKEVVYPGDTVKAEITMASPMIFRSQLVCGDAFEFCEGARIIGTGRIVEILNSELNASPNNDSKEGADRDTKTS